MAQRTEGMMNRNHGSERPLRELLAELTHDLGTLVRKEAELAKAELSLRVDRVTGYAGTIAAGATVLLAGGLALVATVILALVAMGISPWLSALLTGVVLTLTGVAVLRSGLTKLQRTDLTPRRTVRQAKESVAWIKEQVS